MASWIKGALGRRGALHEDLHVPLGDKIPRYLLLDAAKRNDVVGKRARLVLTLEGFHKKASPVKRKKAKRA